MKSIENGERRKMTIQKKAINKLKGYLTDYLSIEDYEEVEEIIKDLEQESCEDCISRADALRVAKNEYLRGWHNALCKALEEGNFSVIQEETITGLGLSMDCAVGKDVESYMSGLPSATPAPKKCHNENRDYDSCDQFVCSNCGIELQDWHAVERSEDGDITYHEYEFKYCPNCGAKMESEEA